MAQQDVDQEIKSQMEKVVDTYDTYMKRATFGREAKYAPGDCLAGRCQTRRLFLGSGLRNRYAGPGCQKSSWSIWKAFGIDIIPGMIEASHKKAVEAGEEINFQEGSIADIPFDKNSFRCRACAAL